MEMDVVTFSYELLRGCKGRNKQEGSGAAIEGDMI
jgi:hypothetical protein